MTEPQRTCPSCGNEFSGAMEFCPVCIRRSDLGGIPSPKSKRVRRGRIPTTSLVPARSALSLGLIVGSPALSNKRFNARRGHLGYKRSAKGGVLSQRCLGELVIKGPSRLTALAKPCSL